MDTLSALQDAELAIEKLRVEAEVRLSHLKLQHRRDLETEGLHEKLCEMEDYITGRVGNLIQLHPAYPWFSRILGIGRENIAKVVGQVRVKPSDEVVCRACHIYAPRGATECPKCQGPMAELGYAHTISGLWQFSGWGVDDDGHAPRREKGQKSTYNSQLRSLSWRLGTSLMKAGLRQQCRKCGAHFGASSKDPDDGVTRKRESCPKCGNTEFETVAISKFAGLYLREKGNYEQRFLNRGYKILPTPAGKWLCRNCGAEKKRKGDTCCTTPDVVRVMREEPEGIIWQGHLHSMALRKMIKIFEACLWLVWRRAEGLPVTAPYAIDKLGHGSFIDPWEMVDKPGPDKKMSKAIVGE